VTPARASLLSAASAARTGPPSASSRFRHHRVRQLYRTAACRCVSRLVRNEWHPGNAWMGGPPPRIESPPRRMDTHTRRRKCMAGCRPAHLPPAPCVRRVPASNRPRARRGWPEPKGRACGTKASKSCRFSPLPLEPGRATAPRRRTRPDPTSLSTLCFQGRETKTYYSVINFVRRGEKEFETGCVVVDIWSRASSLEITVAHGRKMSRDHRCPRQKNGSKGGLRRTDLGSEHPRGCHRQCWYALSGRPCAWQVSCGWM
jgi:hypothetical protein